MPRGDRTGPVGAGPMTGRAAGYCAGYDNPGYMNPIPGRRFGFHSGWWGSGFRGAGRGGLPWGGGRGRAWGGGRGPGWGWGYYSAPPAAYVPGPYAAPFAPLPTNDQEIEALKTQADYFKDALSEIEKRIDELKKSVKEDQKKGKS